MNKIKAISINKGCVSCGKCERICPEVFSVVKGEGSTVSGTIFKPHYELILEAQASCPVAVIECIREDGESTRRPKQTQCWVILRKLHVYTALPMAVLFIFFAMTGLLANRSTLFDNQTESILPSNIKLVKGELVGFLKSKLPEGVILERFTDKEDEITIDFKVDEKQNYVVNVYPADRNYYVTLNLQLPPNILMEKMRLIEILSKPYPGTINRESIEDDESSLEFSIESVWGDVDISVDKGSRSYQVVENKEVWLESLIHLHTGRHASAFQKIIIDFTAIILILATLTGIMLSLQNCQKRARIITVLIIFGSVFICIGMLINR